MRAGGALQLLDVREAAEWRAAHIPGSVHVPYHDIHCSQPGSTPSGRWR